VRPDPLSALFAELGRLSALDLLERELHRRGYRHVAGVDEAGRGSLAGPVVAAAVILPEGVVLPGLDDSKRLDAPSRERLDAQVRRLALAVSVGIVGSREIDLRDILRASLEAMRLAVEALSLEPEALLIDAVAIPGVRRPQLPVVHGDALCSSIAAASIVAKVYRDRVMDEMARRHPVYGFEHHRGYGTPEHWHALRLYGPCPEHRLSYHGVVGGIEPEELEAGNRRPKTRIPAKLLPRKSPPDSRPPDSGPKRG
jgi:ribonuclease HII